MPGLGLGKATVLIPKGPQRPWASAPATAMLLCWRKKLGSGPRRRPPCPPTPAPLPTASRCSDRDFQSALQLDTGSWLEATLPRTSSKKFHLSYTWASLEQPRRTWPWFRTCPFLADATACEVSLCIVIPAATPC